MRESTASRGQSTSVAANLRAATVARASMRRGARPSTARHNFNASVASRIDRAAGAASPAESVSSMATTATTAGTKRKERDYQPDGEETNINVVMRCRGRNDREVRENSAVVVSTDGVKGKTVELSMGPSALSNKTYNFDRVFSQAADQSMIFDDVVKPILDEMLAGFNCTIFAYGQTGTGKTYTMSGDMSDTFGLLSDAAGIIPRVLQSLFNQLELDDTESCVKCSFIELYNEELRDLLQNDDGNKLKIYDDNSRKGHATTVVQGMEERHIQNAAEGIKRLQEGSLRRQVAATKCNDLSSRSHTVFTITVHVKKPSENGGEDYLCAGKLNLVDLAGSENIQRSGAENKRAAEAGLINKSLLTLGRVINALVDRSAHIPYRESKLTRLLQDSLGGRTKTCIIATVSPAKSNLEETISTLDYAFRAKNIRNKPQVNALINKKTLLREFTAEIEKLKSELIATRQRNGVYMSNDAYEEMLVQGESRRILAEEQGAKIETLESNLRNKVQELFALTSSFMGLRREHDGTRAQLEEAREVLDQTELVLAATRKTLAEETHLRKAHQETEGRLTTVGGQLIATLRRTVDDVDGLRAKNKRKSDLQTLNRSTWAVSQAQVAEVTELVEGRIQALRGDQERHIAAISQRMQSFVQEELQKLSSTQAFLDENLARFAVSKKDLTEEREKSKEEMDDVLGEIKDVRDHITSRVGDSLQAIAGAAERIAEDVLSELDTFHNQLHSSYSSIGKDVKSTFEDLLRHISAQKSESDDLRRQLEGAGETIVKSNASVANRLQEILAEERRQAAEDRQRLLSQLTSLVNNQAELQEARLAGKASAIRGSILESNKIFEATAAEYSQGMDAWDEKGSQFVEEVARSRDALKTKLKDDWTAANEHSTSIQNTTKSVHAETVRVVDEQMRDLHVQMRDLDSFVTRARSQNAQHQSQHADSMQNLSSTVEQSYAGISAHFADTFGRVKDLGDGMESQTADLCDGLAPAEEQLRAPLATLREDMAATALREYEPTGQTPERVQYVYPTTLPRTAAPDTLLGDIREEPTPSRAVPVVFNDGDTSAAARSPSRPPTSSSSAPGGGPTLNRAGSVMSLREVNPNVNVTANQTATGPLLFDPAASTISLPPPSASAQDENENTVPLFKRSTRGGAGGKKGAAGGGKNATVALDGIENVPPTTAVFAQSMSRRKSPRLN